MKNNFLIKTIMFIIVTAITCLVFFGLCSDEKTDLELVSFGFLLFAELVVYLSIIIPGMVDSKNVTGADIVSIGVLYALTVVILNYHFSFTEMRPLIIYNVIAILIYLLVFSSVLLMKKK